MPHRRALVRLATLAVATAAVCSVQGTAEAKRWTVPRTGSFSVAVSGAERDAPRAEGDALEDALMGEINAARAAHGLRKIWSYDACTDRLAEDWGRRIARTGVFAHRDQDEVNRVCGTSWAGETLVRGYGLTPDAMVDLWLDSPSHREILLSPHARRAGVSVGQDAQGRVIGVLNLVRHG